MPLRTMPARRLPPEVDLLVLSFLGHFAWEILQAPLFSSLSKTEHFVGIAICLKATLGDLVIAIAAFWERPELVPEQGSSCDRCIFCGRIAGDGRS